MAAGSSGAPADHKNGKHKPHHTRARRQSAGAPGASRKRRTTMARDGRGGEAVCPNTGFADIGGGCGETAWPPFGAFAPTKTKRREGKEYPASQEPSGKFFSIEKRGKKMLEFTQRNWGRRHPQSKQRATTKGRGLVCVFLHAGAAAKLSGAGRVKCVWGHTIMVWWGLSRRLLPWELPALSAKSSGGGEDSKRLWFRLATRV